MPHAPGHLQASSTWRAQDLGNAWLSSQGVADRALVRMGFHAVPSMAQLHLHVTCQDALTPGLKTKRHWHSFTHDGFFLRLPVVRADLQRHGALRIDSAAEDLLKQPLACHRCRRACRDMPTLRSHVDGCTRAPAQ